MATIQVALVVWSAGRGVAVGQLTGAGELPGQVADGAAG